MSKYKRDFPILNKQVNGKDLVYLDNAATSQSPSIVIEAISDFYRNHRSNVHRGIHMLSEESTKMYEDARKKVAKFIGARFFEEIIFTKGTTESLNRVAIGYVLNNLKKGDIVLTTLAEHHSNLVPWQEETRMVGAKLEFIELNIDKTFNIDNFKKKLTPEVKLVAISHVSNVTGEIFPVKRICKLAKENRSLVSVDGAQAVSHMPVSVGSLGCAFYSFSGHKMLGPMGIGVLWVRKEILENMEPYEYGGGMIDVVSRDSSTWAKIPHKFEAGTPNVVGAVGLAVAVEYLERIGMKVVYKNGVELTAYAMLELLKIEGLKIIGSTDIKNRVGLVSFSVEGVHPHDIASVLDSDGIAVRAGQHCARLLHEDLGIIASTRASFNIYNTKEDIDSLIKGLKKSIKLLR